VFASPRNARVADLVGIQNHFKGRFYKQQPGWGLLRWEDPSSRRALELCVLDKNRLIDGANVSWVLAGELVDVDSPVNVSEANEPHLKSASSMPTNDPMNRIVCELLELLSLGETSLCTLRPQQLPGQRLMLNLSSSLLRTLGAGVGSRVRVSIPREGIHIMPQRSHG
jgi:molybdate transport system ATP-binding protein